MYDINFEDGAPIRVANVALNSKLTLANGPANMMVREAFQNAIEAFRHESETVRTVWIRAKTVPGFSAPKLSILNTGRGLSAEQLLEITDLNGSLKKTGTGTDENRGEGIKVASLHYNPLGVVWRSCKDGVIHEASLGYSSRNGWVRGFREDGYGNREESWEVELTEIEQKYHYRTESDWVEVIFLGRENDQNTFLDPYGRGSTNPDTVKNELMTRYFSIPTIERVGLQVEVLYCSSATFTDIGMEGDSLTLPAKTITEARSYQTERVALKGHPGVTVEFIHAKTTPARKNFPARGGLVVNNEQYKLRMDHNWRNDVFRFGLVSLGNQLSVLVHLPNTDEYAADRYREGIKTTDSRDEISLETFRGAIEASRPAWVKKLIAAQRIPSTRDHKKDLESFLKTLEAEKSLLGELQGKGGGASGKATGKGKPIPGNNNNTGTTNTNLRPKKDGKATVRMLIPNVEWLKDASTFPDLDKRTVMFVSDDKGGTLYFNMDSPLIEEFGTLCLTSYLDSSVQEHTRDFVLQELRDFIVNRVGRFVVYQQFLRGTNGYSVGDVTDALGRSGINNVVISQRESLEGWARDLAGTNRYRRAAQGGPPDTVIEVEFDENFEDVISLPA